MKKETTNQQQESKHIIEREYVTSYPAFEAEYFSQYTYALNSVIDNEGVYNIGIVSSYGAGKSSFITTFFEQYPSKKKSMCRISLANFNSRENKTDSESETENVNVIAKELNIKDVEKSILEQIIFKRKYHPFSHSQINRIHGKFWRNFFISLLSVTFIISLYFLFSALNSKIPNLDAKWNPLFLVVSVVLLFALILLILETIKINKLAIKDIEIEFAKDTDSSILNRFLDEIINYCIETGDKYFVFEDIDRFNCVQLFNKLREINYLLNGNEAIKKNNKKITFILCVKEGVFNSAQERSKYFDFIISLVPYYNPDNARQIVENKIKKNKDLEMDWGDVKELTCFVTDVRVLNCIINDFIMYKDFLKIKNEDNIKLFAMMIYKNLYFDDFDKAQHNSGFLYNVFNEHKSKALENASSSITKKIEELMRKKDNSTEDDSIEDKIKNLNFMINGIIALNGSTDKKLPKGYTNNVGLLTYKEVGDGLYISTTFKNMYGSTESCYKFLSINDLKIHLDNKTPYEVELMFIENTKQRYAKEIDKLNKELANYRLWSAFQLFQKGYYEKNCTNQINNNPYFKFALLNEFIDENYFMFTGRPDTAVDNNFIKVVLNNGNVDPEQIVQNPELVIANINASRFGTRGILNYSIVDAVLSSGNKNQKKKNILIDYLSNRSQETIEFLSNYFSRGTKSKIMLKELAKTNYYSLASDIYKNSKSDGANITYFISALIDIASENDIIAIFNKDGVVKTIMENDEHLIEKYYLKFNNPDDFVLFLKKIGVEKIKRIDDFRAIMNIEMKKYYFSLYESCLLENNSYNLSVAAPVYYHKTNVSLSDLLNTKNNEVSNFYLNDLSTTISSLYEINVKFSDEEKTTLKVLEDSNIEEEIKVKYLTLIQNKISLVSNLTENVYLSILSNNLLIPKWESLVNIDRVIKNGMPIIAEYIKTNINSFEDTIIDNLFFEKYAKLDSITEQLLTIMCRYLNVDVDPICIQTDKKRSIVIESGHCLADKNLLLNCRGYTQSIFSILKRNPGLTDELLNVFDDAKDYIELITNETVEQDIKCMVIDKYFKYFKDSLKENEINIILKIMTMSPNYEFKSQTIIEFVYMINNEDDKEKVLDCFSNKLSKKQIAILVKENNPALYNILTAPNRPIAIENQVVEKNYYFKLLEKNNLVTVYNRRKKRCNIRTLNLQNAICSEDN